jgi:hypothetical protein
MEIKKSPDSSNLILNFYEQPIKKVACEAILSNQTNPLKSLPIRKVRNKKQFMLGSS